MNQKLKHESKNGKLNVCYLVITHGALVDHLGNMLEYFKNKYNKPPYIYIPNNYFINLEEVERTKLETFLGTKKSKKP